MRHSAITVTPLFVGELRTAGDGLPIYVHLIDHPDGRVLVDTGMTELHPAVADLDPVIRPLGEQSFDLGSIDIVVNTHLHFDHCGGNRLFAGRPIYVQRQELDDSRTLPDYTIDAWVDAPGVQYIAVEGELEVLPGVRLVPAPGHTRGSQIVVVEQGGLSAQPGSGAQSGHAAQPGRGAQPGLGAHADRPLVIAGDTAVWHGELDDPVTEGQRLIRSLQPAAVWLAHSHEPWRPSTGA